MKPDIGFISLNHFSACIVVPLINTFKQVGTKYVFNFLKKQYRGIKYKPFITHMPCLNLTYLDHFKDDIFNRMIVIFFVISDWIIVWFVCLFTFQSTIFQSCRNVSWVEPILSRVRVSCSTIQRNMPSVRLKLVAPWSQIKRSSIEPLHSQKESLISCGAQMEMLPVNNHNIPL